MSSLQHQFNNLELYFTFTYYSEEDFYYCNVIVALLEKRGRALEGKLSRGILNSSAFDCYTIAHCSPCCLFSLSETKMTNQTQSNLMEGKYVCIVEKEATQERAVDANGKIYSIMITKVYDTLMK